MKIKLIHSFIRSFFKLLLFHCVPRKHTCFKQTYKIQISGLGSTSTEFGWVGVYVDGPSSGCEYSIKHFWISLIYLIVCEPIWFDFVTILIKTQQPSRTRAVLIRNFRVLHVDRRNSPLARYTNGTNKHCPFNFVPSNL